jgi:hypothetical protein
MRYNDVMGKTDLLFLSACQEAVARQHEIVPALASALQVKPEDVFYLWAERRCVQRGHFLGEQWAFFFHGLECDVKNQNDGRFLRLDFGPGGRFDTFTAWGIAQFIMASGSPWPAFEELKTLLAVSPPPYNEQSGSLERAAESWHRLELMGLLQIADKNLAAIEQKYTTVNAQGLKVRSLPADFPRRQYHDISVCSRHLISSAGQRMLELLKNGQAIEHSEPLPVSASGT